MAVTNRQAKVVARMRIHKTFNLLCRQASILDNGDLDIGVSSNYDYTYTDNMSTEVPQELKEKLCTLQKKL